MRDLVDYVSALVHLNGGEIVGKTRLQKIAYLLEEKGLGFNDLDFDYHNFGPFSSELAFAVDDAESLGYIVTEQRQGYHAVPYTVFRSAQTSPEFEDDINIAARRHALTVMDGYSALVLELAATAVYLRNHGYPGKYWDEVKKRKPLKATADRIKMAQRLIDDLEV